MDLNLVSLHTTLQTPLAGFDQDISEFRVPVISLFGYFNEVTTCVHLHGCFPYFYIRVTDDADLDELKRALDRVLDVSEKGKTIVRGITLERKLWIYGFNPQPWCFAKVEIFWPHLLKQANRLLQEGHHALPESVERPILVAETHIPFHLQVFADYGIIGMDVVRFESILYRQPTLDSISKDLCNSRWVVRESRCTLEVDASIKQLVIDRTQTSSEFASESVRRVWLYERKLRMDLGLASQPKQPSRDDFKVQTSQMQSKYYNQLRNFVGDGNPIISSKTPSINVEPPEEPVNEIEDILMSQRDFENDMEQLTTNRAKDLDNSEYLNEESSFNIGRIGIDEVLVDPEEYSPSAYNEYYTPKKGFPSIDIAAEVSPKTNLFDGVFEVLKTSHFNIKNDTTFSYLSVEVLTESRKGFVPDPLIDAVVLVCCVSWGNMEKPCTTFFYNDTNREIDVLLRFCKFVETEDPDFLVGYEVQKESWGYLKDRYSVLMKSNQDLFSPLVSRLVNEKPAQSNRESIMSWMEKRSTGLNASGRIVINLWRILRKQVALRNYFLENSVQVILKRRFPSLTCDELFKCFASPVKYLRDLAEKYIGARALINIEILHELNIVTRTCELTRILGIQFEEVLTRGSQYKVEAILCRASRKYGYVLASPTREQLRQQPVVECVPLILEPESSVFYEPVSVLDFQSLYPSIIIAYNICFSTCLGKISTIFDETSRRMGCYMKLPPVPREVLEDLIARDKVWISENGVAFLKKEVREGVLPRMLKEILDTRIMVKATLSELKKLGLYEEELQRLHHKQLGLKMIANVTYGYTAAGFTGRMPCAEIAEAIVQTARCALEKSIEIVNQNKSWNVNVVYGDTDSMFVHTPGRSLKEAFRIGEEIRRAITNNNPFPMFLKLEKVYQPCALLAKKRYVGRAYEHENSDEHFFDDKGIETVRRDGCMLLVRFLTEMIHLVFDNNLVQLKRRFHERIAEVLSGENMDLVDCIFAKEVKLGRYRIKPPGAIVAEKMMSRDLRSKPLYAQRVRYVVVYGEPRSKLRDLVVPPEDIMDVNKGLLLNSKYYVEKQILPALGRLLILLGIDVNKWYHFVKRTHIELVVSVNTLGGYYRSLYCIVCGSSNLNTVDEKVCSRCRKYWSQSFSVVKSWKRTLDVIKHRTTSLCNECISSSTGCSFKVLDIECINIECRLTYVKSKLIKYTAETSEAEKSLLAIE